MCSAPRCRTRRGKKPAYLSRRTRFSSLDSTSLTLMSGKNRILDRDVERPAARRALQELGVFSIKIAAAQETGYPDRLFLIPGGRPLFIEFKRPGERPTPRQRLIHKR